MSYTEISIGVFVFRSTSGSSPSKGVCRAKGSDPWLLLSNRAAIRRYDLATNKYEPLVAKLDSAVAMDFLHRYLILLCRTKTTALTLEYCSKLLSK